MDKKYYVYILECQDGSFYTGISINPEKRLKEHLGSKLGAKYTKAHKPIGIVYLEECPNRSIASRREYEIKQLTKPKKIELVNAYKKSALKPWNYG